MQSYSDKQQELKDQVNTTIRRMQSGRDTDNLVDDERVRMNTERNRNRMNREFLRRQKYVICMQLWWRCSLREVKWLEEQERQRRLHEQVRIDQPYVLECSISNSRRFLKDIKSLREFMSRRETATPEDDRREEMYVLTVCLSVMLGAYWEHHHPSSKHHHLSLVVGARMYLYGVQCHMVKGNMARSIR